MRSEKVAGVAGGRHARVRERVDHVLMTSTAVLLVEAVVGVLAHHVWRESLETTGRTQSATGLLLLVVAAPFLSVAAALVALVLSATAVAPVLAGAGWLGRRCSGREAWWWVPVTAGGVTAVATATVVTGRAPGDSGFVTALAVWGAGTTALTVPALLARLLLLPGRPRLSDRTVAGRLALGGTLAVVTAWAVAGAVLWAGVAYEPPRLDGERIRGTWSDGRGGTLTFAPDGGVTADGVETRDPADVDPVVRRCGGTGTWRYDPGDGPWAQRISVAVEGCEPVRWSVYGSPEHPKIFVHVGDPDVGDVYVLRKGAAG
ncbi:hypothetical protein [Streptomyces sp. NPDC058757]|uniref:hypothetical protein n=1 Tax=Streptomyces sp. NPDC058757 TaxID=3346626 RepID=UPI00369848D1